MKKISIICGSLRKASTNAGILRAITQTKDQRFKFDWVDIHNIPIFNEDIEVRGNPESVENARRKFGQCDAMLFGVPEYNHTIASPLKNAYDWLSRADGNKYCPVQGKVGAMVSSGGSKGGQRAQIHFRQSLSFRKIQLLRPTPQAELLIKRFSGKIFDENGQLIDQGYKKRISLFLDQFYSFILKHKK